MPIVLLLSMGLGSAAPRATLGPVGGEAEVEVPLIRGFGDPRPRVEVRLDEVGPPVQAVLDLGGPTVRIGVLLAIRRGLRFTRGGGAVALDGLRIGELRVDGVTTQVVPGDELVIGAGALGDVGVAILASRGTVRFTADRAAPGAGWVPLHRAVPGPWRERGLVRRAAVHDAFVASIGGRRVGLRLRTDLAHSSLALEGAEEQLRDGAVWRRAAVGLPGGHVETRWWRVDERVADPRPEVVGELGADVLGAFDVSVSARGFGLWLAPARDPVWTDAAARDLALTEAEAERWPQPAVPDDDRLGRARWDRLAELRFAVGDTAGAAEADARLALVAADRCERWLHIGLRQLRSGTDPREALDRAVAAYEAWAALSPGERARRREAGEAQPVSCEPAIGLRALLGGGPTPIDPLDPGTALAAGRASALRAAIGRGGRGDVGLRTALAVAQQGRGLHAPALAWTLQAARSDDAHPLTTAWTLGPALVAAALAEEPTWLAGRLVLAAGGQGADEALLRDAEAQWVERPGDPAARCARALAETLVTGVDAGVPDLPEADCLTAEALRASASGGDPGPAAAALRARWPDRVR